MYFVLLQTFIFTALLSFFYAVSSRAEVPKEILELAAQAEIPDPTAFMGWKEKQGWATSIENPFQLRKREVLCEDKNLYPTHPQQTTKEYHYFLTGAFDIKKLPGVSRACRVRSSGDRLNAKRCLMAERIEFALISDIYRDRCGNHYRGYWMISFLQKDETMGTLLSQGRTVYEKENSPLAHDMYDGQTYAVPNKEFVFLTDLLQGDDKKISENQNRANRFTHDFNSQTLLFNPKSN